MMAAKQRNGKPAVPMLGCRGSLGTPALWSVCGCKQLTHAILLATLTLPMPAEEKAHP